MKEFKILVEDKPGELARVAESLAARAVNIKAIASEVTDGKAFLRIVTGDVITTEKALTAAAIGFEQTDILDISLIDRPGELAKVAKKLGKAKVNIRSIYIIGQKNGKTEVALVVDNMNRAREILD